MKKRVLFGLTPLLILALASCVMYNGKGDPKKKDSKSSASQGEVSEPSSSESEPAPISSSSEGGHGGSSESSESSQGGEVIPGKEVKVYLVFGEYGVYQGSQVSSNIESLFLEHAIETTLKVGDALPASPAVSSTVSGSKFVGWTSYDNGILSTYTTVPDEDGKILYASFSGGNGTNPGGSGQGGQGQGGGEQGGGDQPIVDDTTYLCSSGTDIAFSGYGFKFSDNTYMSGQHVGEDNGFDQYLIANRGFKKDQVFQLIDFSNGGTWAVPVDGYSFGGSGDETWKSFLEYNTEAQTYKVLKSFNANGIYIKLKMNEDQIYFGLGQNQSEDKQIPGEPGQQGGGEQGSGQSQDGDDLPSSGYGLKFSDKNYVVAAEGEESEGFKQYTIASYSFKKYQEFSLIDFTNKATWAVPVDGYSFSGENATDNKWESYLSYNAEAGTYTVLKDFNSNGIYIKLKLNADNIYIGLADEQPGGGEQGQGGGEQGQQEPLPADKGYGLKFSDGTFTVAEQAEPDNGFEQYKIENKAFKKDQVFSLIDFATTATWAIAVDGYSFGGQADETWKQYLELNNNSYKVLKDFTAENIYLKLKYGEDNIYFGIKEEGQGGEQSNLPTEGYGFLFSDNSYVLATYVNEEDGYSQYKIENQAFKKDQVFQVADFGNNFQWAFDVNPYSFGGTSAESENWKEYINYNATEDIYTVLKDFECDAIYIKFKYEADNVYFGLKQEQGQDDGMPKEGYGFKVNGTTYIESVYVDEQDGFKQYRISGVGFAKDDVIQLYDFTNKNTWLAAVNDYSFGGDADITWQQYLELDFDNKSYKVLKDFDCDTIYIKIKTDSDNIYFQLASGQGSGEQLPVNEGYGFKFSDKTYVVAEHVDPDNGFDQYRIENKDFTEGQIFQLINFANGDTWVVPLDGFSFGGESASSEIW